MVEGLVLCFLRPVHCQHAFVLAPFVLDRRRISAGWVGSPGASTPPLGKGASRRGCQTPRPCGSARTNIRSLRLDLVLIITQQLMLPLERGGACALRGRAPGWPLHCGRGRAGTVALALPMIICTTPSNLGKCMPVWNKSMHNKPRLRVHLRLEQLLELGVLVGAGQTLLEVVHPCSIRRWISSLLATV